MLISTLPLAELLAQSGINDAALAAGDDPNFANLIRALLAPRRPMPVS